MRALLRQYNAAVLGSSTGMFPRLSSQLEVHGAADAFVDDGFCIDPCVYDEAGAGLEAVCLALLVRRVEVVEQRRGGDLCGRMARTRSLCRRSRVDRHARVVDEAHGCGLRRVAPSVVRLTSTIESRREGCADCCSECQESLSPSVRASCGGLTCTFHSKREGPSEGRLVLNDCMEAKEMKMQRHAT
mgnify:CR=1 FL=1